MLEQLCARLSARALATNELTTTLTLEVTEDRDIRSSGHPVAPPSNQVTGSPDDQITRSLRLPVPMLDPKVFLKLLQLDLQTHPPGAPVWKVSIEAQPAEPRRTQDGLFQPSAPEPERLEVTLARIQSAVDGRPSLESNNVVADQPCAADSIRAGIAEILDTHRPDAFRIKRFSLPSTVDHRMPATGSQRPATAVTALRLFRPPVAALVVVRAGKPARVECESILGEITWAAGPWKSSGEWWNEKPWAREEWDVCVGAACYRIYRDARGWFVEGTYD